MPFVLIKDLESFTIKRQIQGTQLKLRQQSVIVADLSDIYLFYNIELNC